MSKATRILWDSPIGFAVGFKPVMPATSQFAIGDVWDVRYDDGTDAAKPFFSDKGLVLIASDSPTIEWAGETLHHEGPFGEMSVWRSQRAMIAEMADLLD